MTPAYSKREALVALGSATLVALIILGLAMWKGAVSHSRSSSVKTGTPQEALNAHDEGHAGTDRSADAPDAYSERHQETEGGTWDPVGFDESLGQDVSEIMEGVTNGLTADRSGLLPMDNEEGYDPQRPLSNTTIPGTICYAAHTEDLAEAVEYGTCETVVLMGRVYEVEREILVCRDVIVQGTPALRPVLNAEYSPRNFRVKPGAHLTVRHVVMIPSEASTQAIRRRRRRARRKMRRQNEGHEDGEYSARRSTRYGDGSQRRVREGVAGDSGETWRRKRGLNGSAEEEEGLSVFPFMRTPEGHEENSSHSEPPNSRKPLYIRGGCVYLERGAAGALFESVYFVDAPDPVKAVERAIHNTLIQRRIRVYGGMVLSVDAPIDFVGCLFYDFAVLIPLTNLIFMGGQVLMLRGRVTMTGCAFTRTNLFGREMTIGTNVAVLAGELIMSFVTYQENNLAINLDAIGEAFFMGAGVTLLTAMEYNDRNVLYVQSGTGQHTVMAGVLIATGWTNMESIAIGFGYGVGFEMAVGVGLQILTAFNFHEFAGIFADALLGEAVYLGAGELVSVGSNLISFMSLRAATGLGHGVVVIAGQATIIGTPFMEIVAISSFIGLGETVAVGAGLLTIYGGVFMSAIAMEVFIGLGEFIFVGGGALFLAGTALIDYQGPISTESTEIWVQGECEPPEEEREQAVNDNATTEPAHELPTFWDGSFGCNYGDRLIWNYLAHLDQREEDTHSQQTRHTDVQTTKRRRKGAKSTRGSAHRQTHVHADAHKHTPTHTPTRTPQLKGLPTAVDGMQANNVSIYLRDVTRSTSIGDLARFNLPVPTTKAIAFVLEQMNQFRSHLGLNTKPRANNKALLHIEHTPRGTCTADIDADMLKGPGAKACGPNPAHEEPPPSPNELVYTPYYIVKCQLEPTSRSTEALNISVLQGAVTAAVHQWAEAQNIVEVIRAQVHASLPSLSPELWEAMEDLGMASFQTDDGQSYVVVLVATSATTRDALLEALQEVFIGHVSENVLGGMLKDQLRAQGIGVDTTGLTFASDFEVPAYNAKDIGSHSVRRLGRNSLLLLAPDMPSVHLTHVQLDKEHFIRLANFQPGKRVAIALRRADEVNPSDSLVLLSLTTDTQGHAEVPYTFRRTAIPQGEYFLEASADGILSHTELFTVTHTPRRTTLYGPSVRI